MIHRTKGNLADAVLTSTDPWEQRVDRLFLSVLSRPPRPDERQRFVAHLTSDPKAEPLVEEAIWVLLKLPSSGSIIEGSGPWARIDEPVLLAGANTSAAAPSSRGRC